MHKGTGLRVGPTITRQPVGHQRGLAAARLAMDHQRWAFPLRGVVIKALQVRLAPHVNALAGFAEGLVVAGLLLQGRELGLFRVFLVDGRPEIFQHVLPEGLRVGVVFPDFPHRCCAGPDAGFQVGQLLRCGSVLGGMVTAVCLGIARVAEIKKGATGGVGIVQDAVQDFQLGQALVAVSIQPFLFLDQSNRELTGHPAVAFAQQADEVGAAEFNLLQADGQHLAVLRLLLSDAPAQVHLHEIHAPLRAAPAQLRENLLHQHIPLHLHVAEGG